MKLHSTSKRKAISTTGAIGALVVVILILFGMAYMNIGSLDSKINSLQSSWSKYQQSTPQQTSSTVTRQTTTPTVQPTVRHITLIAKDARIEIANNVYYDAWTFNGTVPGPTIFV